MEKEEIDRYFSFVNFKYEKEEICSNFSLISILIEKAEIYRNFSFISILISRIKQHDEGRKILLETTSKIQQSTVNPKKNKIDSKQQKEKEKKIAATFQYNK